ncbi:MAG TPA: hypothetical protein VK732_03365 [Verrucomicrobiae bacterium]|nr:hypothetical protein [Verrucomicrobiae bacterium]
MRLIRFGLFGFAFWMIGFGIFIFLGSLSAPMAMPGLMPLAALMGVVLGILLLLALWAFPLSSRRGRAYSDEDD